MTDKRIVLTTAGSQEEAQKLADSLVESKLAACVNLIPHVSSVYRWKGKVERSDEYLLIVKTTAVLLPLVLESIQQLHSYELPEFIVLDIADGSSAYLKWLGESVDQGT